MAQRASELRGNNEASKYVMGLRTSAPNCEQGVAHGVTTLLHQQGVYGQILIKKWCYWPKHVPGDYIDAYMMVKLLGMTERFVKELGGFRFFVHCTQDADSITKIMSTHGVFEEIQDHLMLRFVDGEWKTFKYARPFSCHNRAKHWVKDVNINNCRHDPIGLPIRMYCACDPGAPLCSICFGFHAQEHGH
jgi:hypothetical protein